MRMVQITGLGLRQRPEDSRQRYRKDDHPQRFMRRKQLCLERQFRIGCIGKPLGDDPQRGDYKDQTGGDPVKGLGHGAIAAGGIGNGH